MLVGCSALPVLLLSVATACTSNAILDVEVAAGPGTVLRVSWNTAVDSTGEVRWGEGEDQVVATEQGKAHRAVIVGLEPNLDVTFTITGHASGVELAPAELSTTTVPAPPLLPSLTVTGALPEPLWFVTALASSPPGAAIYSTEGQPAWWRLYGSDPLSITDAQLALDGRSILYNRFTPGESLEAQGGEAPSELVREYLDGHPEEVIATQNQHHAFAQLPDGTITFIVYDIREVEGETVRGDALVERAPDGNETTLWSTWDSFTYEPGTDLAGVGWTHCNSVSWNAEEEAYYVSVRNLNAIVKLSRTGERIWTFGGVTSDFELLDDDGTVHQHRVRGEDGGTGLLVFDNGAAAALGSRVVRYALDLQTMTATTEVEASEGVYTYSLGDVERLPEGGMWVSWGSGGEVTVQGEDGQASVTMASELGSVFGFGAVIPDLRSLAQ
ncbi:hypothetical protein LBMAG42_54000 [Deltaproteobacteria bacterium]|nr:hypothetical protein LBMAG42_54000 [Deltaproteobacteria bacterium]